MNEQTNERMNQSIINQSVNQNIFI